MFNRVLFCVLFVSPAVVAGDSPQSRAKAALALAVATQPTPVAVTTDDHGRTPTQVARAALAEALGIECDCGVCDKPKSMPAVVAPLVMAPKAKVEKLPDYDALAAKVKALVPGESVRVFAGVDVIDDCTYTGAAYHLSGAIPGNAPGIWRCWIDAKSGTPTMQQLHLSPAKK